jgi:hypothetical protein
MRGRVARTARAFVVSAGLVFVASACVRTPVSPPIRLPEGPVAFRARGLDGAVVSVGQLRGRPVVITFVATWADDALVEVRRRDALVARYGEAIASRLVVLDEVPAAVDVFVSSFRPRSEVWRLEGPEVLSGRGAPFGEITMVPTTIVLAADGRIAFRYDGVAPPSLLEAGIDQLLARDPSTR